MKRKYNDRLPLSTLVLAGGCTILAVANWRLVLTLICGTAVMSLVYRFPRGVNPNQRLTWAVLGGSGSIFVCYFLLTLLQSYPNGWVGLGQLLEFIAVFATLGLVLYQNLANKRSGQPTNQLILYLASEDQLTRLIALKQLQQRAVNHSLSFQQEQQLKEYCQVILEQEQSSHLKNTALETIETLQFMNLRPKLKQKTAFNDLSLIAPKEVA